MDYKLVITDQAAEQLDHIIEYLVSHFKNPSAARGLLTEIETIYCHLEKDPFAYQQCNDSFLQIKGYRKATIHHYQYVILFLIHESERTVFISGIFHGRENYSQKL